MKNRFLQFILLLTFSGFAQFSKTHYIPPITSASSIAPQDQSLYISCPSTTPVNFRIIQLGGAIITGAVSRDTPYILNIANAGSDTQIMVPEFNISSVMNNKGYIVEAEDLVYVTVRVIATPEHYHAGGLVSKGLAALGTQFRIGAFINTGTPSYTSNYLTFASILATENNTEVSFGDIESGVLLVNNAGVGNTPTNVILNAGESYVIAVKGPNAANKDGLIGSFIHSTKPIAVNCGSFAGSDGNTGNLDLGFDQIVSAERTGKEYIFIKGNGLDVVERPIIVANTNNTQVFLNGSATPFTTLNAGDYVAIDGSQFSANNNLYVNTSEKVFAYQGIGGSGNQANQNLHFLPPLSCETPKIINNIPYINQVGTDGSFTGTVCIVTETGATLTFLIDGTSYTLATLPVGISVNGSLSVTGNTGYETYIFNGFNGNVSVFSTKSVYLSYFGSSGAATYGGFYSGFTFKPEITQQVAVTSQPNCIPNASLSVSSLTSFDTFQWYFNGNPIAGAITNQYLPTQPGYYRVEASISTCPSPPLISDNIPVSDCASNRDNDLLNDNVDIDNDNDGLINCFESLGNQNINLSNPANGNIMNGSYNNSFTGIIANSMPASTVPFTGNADGTFITEIPAGKGYYVSYNQTYSQPINIRLEYPNTANSTDLINSNAEYIVNSDVNKTITVLNPTDQLLIDTNYDGIYESGVTQFSSFEIRFRLNGSTPLPAGTGTFSFQSFQVTNFKITHKNLSDISGNKSTFKLVATCLPFDTDGDTIPNQLDIDSDNDGMLDITEVQVNNAIVISNIDTNLNGLDDAFEPGLTPIDSDLDTTPDYLDLDSDNDGIYDLNESNCNATDADLNGRIDGNAVSFGSNGLSDSVETSIDSGNLNYIVADTDTDGIKNYRELDSDNDGCNDVIEANYPGTPDANGDGLLGAIMPPTTNANGVVTSGTGYLVPSTNYTTFAPIIITTQPNVVPTCELQNALVTLSDNGGNTYQWQVSTNGTTWTNCTNIPPYTNTTTNTLTIATTNAMNGYKYRVILNKVGNSCGLISAETTLTVLPLPVVTSPMQIIQCDDDLDAIAAINLTINNNLISANAANETFTYFTTLAGAQTQDTLVQITNPGAFTNTGSPGTITIWTRVENSNGCFKTVQIDALVIATQIPSTYSQSFTECDDTLAIDGTISGNPIINRRDGITNFNISSVTTDLITNVLPAGTYNIKYYRNTADRDAQINAIPNPSNFRNDIANTQTIWGRVDSTISQSCYGFAQVFLTVEALPYANPVAPYKECDDNQDGILTFNTSNLETTLLGTNQNYPVTVTYFDNATNTPLTDINGIVIASPFPASFETSNKIIKAVVTNNTTNACTDEVLISFIVDVLPIANPVTITPLCEDLASGSDNDGQSSFDTSNFQNTILGSQTGMVVIYTDSSGNVLTTLPNPFVTRTQNIVATVTNPLNANCVDTTTLVFVVNPLPNIFLVGDELVCSNDPNINVTINAGISDGTSSSNYTYSWSLNGNVISPPQNSYVLNVNTEGIYTVTVNNTFSCSRTRTITVVSSNIATILPTSIVELSDNNTITINTSGDGDYIYSLNEEFGPFQESTIFTNVMGGIHTIYVKDKNGCGTAKQEIYVLGVPKYFTPNNDGIHDYWNVQGISSLYNAKTKIYIFDRFGKLMKQLSPLGQGWDGTFTGKPMPATDYWYSIEFEDGRITKGNFALKR